MDRSEVEMGRGREESQKSKSEKRKSEKSRSRKKNQRKPQETRCRFAKAQEDRKTLCFPMFCGSRGSKSRLAKAAGAELAS